MAQDILYDIKQACIQLSLPVPADAFGSQDETALMMSSSANAAGKLINGLREWQIQLAPVEFAGDGQRTSYSLPPDFDRFVDSSGWSMANQCPVRPINSQQWTALLVRQATLETEYFCRLFGGKLEFITAPMAGDVVNFEYVRKTWVLDADDQTTRKEVCDKNGDIPVFDWLTMVLAIKVKWRELKGMDTTAAMSDLIDSLNNNASADVLAGTLSLVPRRAHHYLNGYVNLPDGGYGGP